MGGIFVALVLFCKIEHEITYVDKFDIVEVNHHLNEWGQERWTQIILWNWHRLDRKYHVEHFYMLNNCYKRTKSGEIAHNKMLDIIERFIPDIRKRQRFRQESAYKGDFEPTERYPRKDWKTGKYVIEYVDNGLKRKIECNSMQVTFTQDDPEVLDKARHPQKNRTGLTRNEIQPIDYLVENIQKAIQDL